MFSLCEIRKWTKSMSCTMFHESVRLIHATKIPLTTTVHTMHQSNNIMRSMSGLCTIPPERAMKEDICTDITSHAQRTHNVPFNDDPYIKPCRCHTHTPHTNSVHQVLIRYLRPFQPLQFDHFNASMSTSASCLDNLDDVDTLVSQLLVKTSTAINETEIFASALQWSARVHSAT